MNMKRILIAFSVCCLCVGTGTSQDGALGKLEQANNAYESGAYDVAITIYRSLLLDGIRDAVVYFNLGNAYYEAGQPGLALVNYRRAQRIEPRDTEINTNIARIRAERVDLQSGESNLIDRFASSTMSLATISELGWLVFSLWALWLVLLTVAIWRYEWRTHLCWWLVGGGVCLLIGLTLLGSRLYAVHARPDAVVIDLSTQVMSGPGEGYLPIFRLYAAAEIRVLQTSGEWARIVLPDGRQGWVKSDAIEEI
jgi:tetratricopeptide (TPR) repeat protein